MPRSFLVKKYFASKKPNYSELESQAGARSLVIPDNSTPAPEYCTVGLVWNLSILPALYTPVTTASGSPAGPLDLSSPSSSSSEEDEGRTSDPPSPEPPRRCTLRNTRRQAVGDPSTLPPSSPRVTLRCKQCSKEYSSLGALKMHIRSHTLPCVCPTCGKAFSRPWLLRGHIRTHTGERPFSCPHCSRAFADRSNLRAHLQTHADVKRYQCGTCARTFSRVSLLHKHSGSGCSPAPV